MVTYSAVRNKRPNSLQVVQKLSGHSIMNKEKLSKGDAKWEKVMRVRRNLNEFNTSCCIVLFFAMCITVCVRVCMCVCL